MHRAKIKVLAVGTMGFIMGTAFASFLWIWPWSEQRASRSWQETPCTILEVRVVTETGHQGVHSFKPRVLYEYEFAGENHKSSHLDFSADMGFNYARTRSLVEVYHAGETTTCFVNPAQPGEAVLARRFRPDPFFSLFTAGVLGASLFLIIQGLPRKPRLATVNPWEASSSRAAEPAGQRISVIDDADVAFHEQQYQKLRAELQAAFEASSLPELPSEETRRALNDLLIRVRMKGLTR